MLEVSSLFVSIDKKPILNGISFRVRPGEIHALMGPNGSGKSTLSLAIAGHPALKIEQGQISFNGRDITNLRPEERARLGIFLAFQYPLEVPGVSFFSFLRAAYNSVYQDNQLGVEEFRRRLKEKLPLLKMNEDFLFRNLNEGFSGGEKKKAEILQLAALEPKMAILDETDSGLDIDALKTVADAIKTLSVGRGLLLITHYQRILDYLEPNFVHLMVGGKIVKSGGPELAKELEEKGYEAASL